MVVFLVKSGWLSGKNISSLVVAGLNRTRKIVTLGKKGITEKKLQKTYIMD